MLSIFSLKIENKDIRNTCIDVSKKKSLNIVCLNPHSLRLFIDDEDYAFSIKNYSYFLIDGIGLKFLLKIKYLGEKIKINRITGRDFFLSFLSFINSREKTKIAILGPDLLQYKKLREDILVHYENIDFKLISLPYVKKKFSRTQINKINQIILESKIDYVINFIGAPKQEILSASLLSLNNSTYINVGAVVDQITQNKLLLTKIFSFFGLEWLLRLILEPRKIFVRIFISPIKVLIYYIKFEIIKKIK